MDFDKDIKDIGDDDNMPQPHSDTRSSASASASSSHQQTLISLVNEFQTLLTKFKGLVGPYEDAQSGGAKKSKKSVKDSMKDKKAAKDKKKSQRGGGPMPDLAANAAKFFNTNSAIADDHNPTAMAHDSHIGGLTTLHAPFSSGMPAMGSSAAGLPEDIIGGVAPLIGGRPKKSSIKDGKKKKDAVKRKN